MVAGLALFYRRVQGDYEEHLTRVLVGQKEEAQNCRHRDLIIECLSVELEEGLEDFDVITTTGCETLDLLEDGDRVTRNGDDGGLVHYLQLKGLCEFYPRISQRVFKVEVIVESSVFLRKKMAREHICRKHSRFLGFVSKNTCSRAIAKIYSEKMPCPSPAGGNHPQDQSPQSLILECGIASP